MHRKEAWDHTASLVAMIHNVNCMSRGDAISPAEAHPYRHGPEAPEIKISVHDYARMNLARR